MRSFQIIILYNYGTPSGFGVTLQVYHGRYRGYYNETLSGLGIADTVTTLLRAPYYHGLTVQINIMYYNGTPSGFSVTLQVYHGRNRGYYNETLSGFGVTLPVYHGRNRGYYNETLSGLGIADTTLLRAPYYHGLTVQINIMYYNGTPSGFSVTLQVYHGRNRGYYNETLSGLGVTLPVYHGRNRGYYNETLSGLGVTLPVYHGRNRGYYNETLSGFGVTLPVYHGRNRGYYNGTLSGLGIASLRYCGCHIITVDCSGNYPVELWNPFRVRCNAASLPRTLPWLL